MRLTAALFLLFLLFSPLAMAQPAAAQAAELNLADAQLHEEFLTFLRQNLLRQCLTIAGESDTKNCNPIGDISAPVGEDKKTIFTNAAWKEYLKFSNVQTSILQNYRKHGVCRGRIETGEIFKYPDWNAEQPIIQRDDEGNIRFSSNLNISLRDGDVTCGCERASLHIVFKLTPTAQKYLITKWVFDAVTDGIQCKDPMRPDLSELFRERQVEEHHVK